MAETRRARRGRRRGFPATARGRALAVLAAVDERGEPAAAALEAAQRDGALSAADAALAREIVLGVLRHRMALEHVARQFFRGEWRRLNRRLRDVLACAVYQLCYLDRVPEFAVVNEAVELAKAFRGRQTGGLVNAILRSLLRARGPRIVRPDPVDRRCWLAADDERGFLFSQELWPDAEQSPAEYLALTTSHPPWVVRRWFQTFGPQRAAAICAAGARRPALVVRANRLRIDPRGLCARFEARGVRCRVDPECEAIELSEGGPVAEMAEFVEGLFQPQDATSQSVWRLRPPAAGERVVDLCAGAGTKATHAAELMGDTGVVIASDASAERLDRLEANARRLGISSIRRTDPAKLAAVIAGAARPPDLILVDAPCSNSGVFGRRPEARYRLNEVELHRLEAVQAELLDAAAGLAGPNTAILYSTCSIEPEENEGAITAFCQTHRAWRLKASRLTLPDDGREGRFWRDGGFAALLVWD